MIKSQIELLDTNWKSMLNKFNSQLEIIDKFIVVEFDKTFQNLSKFI